MIKMKDKIVQVIGTILGIILIPVLIGLGMSYSRKHDEEYPWKSSFFYIATEHIIDSKDFKTLEDCREWSLKKVEDYGEENVDYNCGRGCTYTDQSVSGGKKVNTYGCLELTK